MFFFKKVSSGLMASLLSAGTIVVCGCSNETSLSDDSGITEGIPTEVTLSLSSLRSDMPEGDGTPEDPSSDSEKINSWWIAFVDHNGTVREIVSRKATGAVEMETFKCTVPAGVYTLYAFANITPAELKSAAGVEFTVGKSIGLPSGVTNIEDAAWSLSLNNWTASKPLPMSGFLKEVRVKNTIEETFSIEVVRMAAKMEFVFSNTGGEDVTVNAITIDPVTVSSISLFPKGTAGIGYSHLGKSAFSPLSGAGYGRVSFPLATANAVKAGEKDKSVTVYLQESVSDRANDEAFTIGINVTHKDGVADYEQYNITRDILSYINRNDHIRIPVTISRYDVDVDAVFYPPIGGYPAAASATDPDGAQIFTFSSEGDFAIVPHIIDKETGRHLAPHYYSVAVSDISDADNIFSVAPTVNANTPALPDEVNGTLKAVKGKASLSVTVSVYDKARYETEAKVTESYTRRIYIIRD